MKRVLLGCLSALAVTATIAVSRSSSDVGVPPVAAALRAFGPIHPRISPQGDTIVFSYQGALWRLPRSGGTMTRLSDGEGFDIEPAWSPDGKWIAYINSRNFSSGDLRIMNAEDGAPVTLAAVQHSKAQASSKLSFDPSGRRVLATFTPESGQPEGLSWFDLETGELSTVLDPPRAVRRPALSQDGKWIAFATNQDVAGQQGGNDGAQADLWRVSSDGGRPERIARWPARIHDLAWEERAPSMYVTSDLGAAPYDIWRILLPHPEKHPQRLTFGQADEDRPSVSRDGHWLVYTDNNEGATALVVLDTTNGERNVVAVTGLNFRKPIGSVRLSIREKPGDDGTAARIAIQSKHAGQADGKFYAPPGALYRIERTTLHFYAYKIAELQLPAGDYTLHAWHGPEFRAIHRDFRVEPEKMIDLAVELERWTDSAALQLYSGENHIHANYGYGEWYNTPESMWLQCKGEDLSVCNFMVANSDGDGVFDRPFFRGEPDPWSDPRTVLYWNQEFRSTLWGHMTLVNLRQVVEPVFTGFKDTTNPWDIPTNADIADRTHWQNGLVNYTHTAQNAADPYLGAYTAKGLPVDAALGKIDSMDLNNSYDAAVPLWYRLLNCGFRIPASAGTDCFLNRIRSRLPGSDRAYVRITGPFSYQAWIDGLRAGRSFVSNGPMLEFRADDKGLGETISLDAPHRARLVARATAQFPLDRLEVVWNGTTVARGKISDAGRRGEIDQDVLLDHSGWLALVASGPTHPDAPGGPQYAHTSPIYVDLKDRPTTSPADAEFFLAWIDRLAAAFGARGRVPNRELEAHVAGQLDEARRRFRKMAGTGR